jgi:single-strand DNA-binding protein
MASVNKALIIGHLGADPEVNLLPSGMTVVNMRIATTKKWKDKASGEKREETEWHRITVYGKQADFAAQFLKKGFIAWVEGRLKTRKWTDKDGAERFTTEIVADDVKRLGQAERATQE